ncbi:MAG: type II toxin-antitoxin system Phd/YefM family antitoxin [Gemmatimonadetes bacterium]|nr:type II toxin-antitoxin system Phd/YefM family antitoxin [Gemmatimonadota bacterium]
MTLNATEARDAFGETLNRVAYGKERVVLSRRGKPMAALIPLEDLALLEKLEDRLDVDAAAEALAESDERLPYEEVRRELGLT